MIAIATAPNTADTETAARGIADIVDLDAYPIDAADSPRGRALIKSCRADLAADGMFNLEGFVRPAALARSVAALTLLLERDSFRHARRHNIYFRKSVPELAPDHPALAESETAHRTICADQFADDPLCRLYEFPPLIDFIRRVTGQPALYAMADPLARLNVMSYGDGQGLGWHFDRSVFTTTILLQAPDAGGVFEYRTDLRSDENPNYPGVARLLAGEDARLRRLPVKAGTLNVFKGRNTAHRVTAVSGDKDRIIAVFSYYPQPNVLFSADERVGFYGRAG
jgi:hypothetical protein